MKALAVLLLLAACHEDSAQTSQTAEAPAAIEPLRAEVRLLGNATGTDELPLVVALHGRGSDPERFARFFNDVTTPARLLLVEAPVEEGNGRAWFSFRGKSRTQLAREMRGLARRVIETTRQALDTHATQGPPVLTGFSQGAMLVYILAIEHPGTFRVAVPVSGALFESFLPQDARNATPLIVLHGEDDPVIPIRGGLRNIDALERAGADVTVRRFPEARHWIAGDMKTAMFEALGL